MGHSRLAEGSIRVLLIQVVTITVVFLLPTALAQHVNVFPPAITEVNLGDTVTFICSPTQNASGFQWFLNGTHFRMNKSNVVAEYTPQGNGLGSLRFTNVSLMYNATEVQCKAIFRSGTNSTLSNPAVLHVVLGSLPPLMIRLEVNRNDITLHWMRILPNITMYCVVVQPSYNESQYCINMTEFTYPIPHDTDCNTYFFTVSAVDAEGSDTEPYSGTKIKPTMTDVSKTFDSGILSINISMSAPVCTVDLIFMDLDNGVTIKMTDTDFVVKENSIIVTTGKLKPNRHYNVTIVASNVAGLATSNRTISTHVGHTTPNPGLEVGAIAGIVIAVIVTIGTVSIVIGIVMVCLQKKRHRFALSQVIVPESGDLVTRGSKT